MADEIFDLKWTVTESGYRLVRARLTDRDQKDEVVLTDGIPFGGRRTHTAYNPLTRMPDLFLEFSKLKPTPEEVVGFANRCGFLSGEWSTQLEGRQMLFPVEPFSLWKDQSQLMNHAVSLWRLWDTRDSRLKDVIHWSDDRVFYKGPLGYRLLTTSTFNAHWFDRWKRGEWREPALAALRYIIDDEIKGKVVGRLLWNEARSALGLHFVPRNLLGAMWLQFARALAGSKKYRPCQVCGRYMEISTDAYSQASKRADALTCGDKCRSQKHRDSIKARGLSKLHASPSAIRKQLVVKYDIATIREWIS